jgi:hypothetical protein
MSFTVIAPFSSLSVCLNAALVLKLGLLESLCLTASSCFSVNSSVYQRFWMYLLVSVLKKSLGLSPFFA